MSLYKINLYPEQAERRRAVSRRVGRSALLTALLAVEILLVGWLFVSGMLLREKAGGLRAEIARLSEQIASTPAPGPEIETARDLLETRRARIDWAPKLAILPEIVEGPFHLRSVSCRRFAGNRPSSMSLEIVSLDRGHLDPVAIVLQRLEHDDRVRRDLPEVRLGTVEDGMYGRYIIHCESPPGREPADGRESSGNRTPGTGAVSAGSRERAGRDESGQESAGRVP